MKNRPMSLTVSTQGRAFLSSQYSYMDFRRLFPVKPTTEALESVCKETLDFAKTKIFELGDEM